MSTTERNESGSVSAFNYGDGLVTIVDFRGDQIAKLNELKGPEMTWDHKDSWRIRKPKFLVEVTRHSVPLSSDLGYGNDGKGPHRWCVYAYVYSTHPFCDKLSRVGFDLRNACNELPMHGGVTKHDPQFNEVGVVVSYKVGADYAHLHDDHFTHYETALDAREVFRDAEKLIDFLEHCERVTK